MENKASTGGPADADVTPALETAVAAVEGLRRAVDVLMAVPLVALTGTELVRAIAEVDVQRNRMSALDVRLLAAASAAGAVAECGATSLARLLGILTRCSRAEARARAARAVDLGRRRAVTGEALAPIHPATAAALAEGQITAAHTTQIVTALGRIRPDAAPEIFEIAENYLVHAAGQLTPDQMPAEAEKLLARLDPDGLEPAEDTTERTRSFSLGPARDGHGGTVPRGRLTPETAAALRAVLDALAAPRPSRDGDRDDRTSGQRYHDALLEMALRLLRCGDLPDSGGTPTSLVIHTGARPDGAAACGSAETESAGEQAAPSRAEPGCDSFSAAGPLPDDTDLFDPGLFDLIRAAAAAEGQPDNSDAGNSATSDGNAAHDGNAAPSEPSGVGGRTEASVADLEAELRALIDTDIDTDTDTDTRADDPAPEVNSVQRMRGAGPLTAHFSGIAHLGDGTPVTLARLRPLIDECEITVVVLTASGGILDYGRERRIATPAMRRALAARDHGCCFPGCDRPPAWTQAHHVWAWIDGGPTRLDNLCLLCAYHHRSFAANGWQVIMHHGVPWWIPPPWLDPEQNPIRNNTHPEAITFGTGTLRTAAPDRRPTIETVTPMRR